MNIPAHLSPLKEALDKSSSVNRNLGLAFISFLVYALVIVVRTTDYQLLVPEEGINLPILNFELPLFGFYIVAPALILILHLNLLISLLKHSEKLYEWKEKAQQLPPEEGFTLFRADGTSYHIPRQGQQSDASRLLSPFMFNYLAGLPPGSFTYRLVRVLVYVSVFLFPLGLLVYIQLRFSDYQSIWMTGYHFALVWVDIVVLGRYVHRIFPVINTKTWWSGSTFGNSFRWLMGGVSMIDLILIIWILSGSTFELLRYGPHLNLTNHSVLLKEVPSQEFIMKRAEEGIPVDSTLRMYGVPLDLWGKNLRFSDFSGVDLFSVNLNGAYLQGAKFRYARLKGANFRFTQLQKADLRNATLYGADFHFAQLDRADLRYSWLPKAVFDEAQLQGANLGDANLQEGNLGNANLQGASLYAAQLQGADLGYAQLQGANLSSARLQGADFSFARLQGADFSFARLQGANLYLAQLQGADLRNAQLQGAGLDEAQLQGVDLRQAQLQGSSLRSTSIQLDPLCGCSWDSSFVVIDSIQDAVNWNSMIQSILPALTNSDTFTSGSFIRRINRAKIIRDSLAEALEHDYQPRIDTAGFLAYRVNMACHWDNDMRCLFIRPLFIGPGSDQHAMKALIYELNRSLKAQIEAHCPDKLKGVDLSNYLD